MRIRASLVFVLSALMAGGAFAAPILQVSAAVTNVIEAKAAWAAFADYTNNVLRIETAQPSDIFPANMPFQLVVGPDAADRQMAEAALTTVSTSMPTHICAYFTKYHLLAPVQQWLIRRAHPSVTNEATYLRAAAHPLVWRAKDFDLAKISQLAATMTSNSVPILANLRPIYEEFKTNPIKRAESLLDYPDPRPEETYATPFGVSIVLRAAEQKRKFRFHASGYPFGGREVTFRWVSLNGGVGINGYPFEDWSRRNEFSPECGCGQLTLGWSGQRRDVFVFARYGDGEYGPPSVISFFGAPNEQRKYERDGRLVSIEYLANKPVLPQLYQSKLWKDEYLFDSQGNIVGFLRTRTGQLKEERFNWLGELVVESYAGDQPKTTQKVRYFTCPDDSSTLDYEVTGETVSYKFDSFTPRLRGEFPLPKKKR